MLFDEEPSSDPWPADPWPADPSPKPEPAPDWEEIRRGLKDLPPIGSSPTLYPVSAAEYDRAVALAEEFDRRHVPSCAPEHGARTEA